MAWGQAIAQGLGRLGAEIGTAEDQQIRIALDTIQSKLMQQEVQQRLRESEQRMKIQGAPHPQFFPTPGGGTSAAQIDPLTGKVGASQTVIPDRARPPELSDEAIDAWGKSLNPQMRESAVQAVKILTNLGEYDKAAELMGKQAKSPKTREVLKPDQNSSTGWSKVTYDADTGVETSRQLDVAPQRGLITRESDTTDPFGLTTHTVSKPVIGGGTAPSAKPTPRTPFGSVAAASKAAINAATPQQEKMGDAFAKKYPLDADWHIPATAPANPLVIEGANELLDGMDIKDLRNPKSAQASAMLARHYGWERGKFTPKEMNMLRESVSIVKQLRDNRSSIDPSKSILQVLDQGWLTRQKLSQSLLSPDKVGSIHGALISGAAMSLTPDEAEFVRLYNQSVGRISGLASLVRSNRPTEATIERLKMELPNPMTTVDSRDARRKLGLILNEVEIAMQKGLFGSMDAPATPALSDAAKQYMQKRGINAPAK